MTEREVAKIVRETLRAHFAANDGIMREIKAAIGVELSKIGADDTGTQPGIGGEGASG